MENRKITIREQLPVFLSQLLLCVAMVGIYAALNRLTWAVLVGAGIGTAVSLLNQEIAKAGRDETMPALLGYTGTSAEQLHKYRQENEDLWSHEVPESIVCGVVGTHAGPGAVAVAFFS